jgi:hypothetical protein
MNWMDKAVESNFFKITIKSAYYLSLAIILLILLMIVNFLFKIHVQDYRFDDGELKPPVVTTKNE